MRGQWTDSGPCDDRTRRQPRLAPHGISHDDGAEVQWSLATVVIGGLFTSMLLTCWSSPQSMAESVRNVPENFKGQSR